MTILVHIDVGRCCGWGNCAQVCPQMFELDPETNRGKLRRAAVADDLGVQVRRAASECPTQAIEVSSLVEAQ
jgi:ferredoxin